MIRLLRAPRYSFSRNLHLETAAVEVEYLVYRKDLNIRVLNYLELRLDKEGETIILKRPIWDREILKRALIVSLQISGRQRLR
jgi:hypothetical protein